MSVTMERDGALFTLEPADDGDGHRWVPYNPSGTIEAQSRPDGAECSRAGNLASQLRERASILSASSAWGHDDDAAMMFAAADALTRINSDYAEERIDLRRDNSDSAIAFAEVLEKAARRIRAGYSAEDAANELAPVVTMARRI